MSKALHQKPSALEGEVITTLRDPSLLADFLDQPKIKIAEAITGLITSDKKELFGILGRLVQARISGRAMEQIGRELQILKEKGKIKENYAETKFGFKSLGDILMFIESEAPDEDRLKAVKTLFYFVIAKDAQQGEEIARYELFKIITKLSASQILVLRACYSGLYKTKQYQTMDSYFASWLRAIAEILGHKMNALVERDEVVLMENKLITPRLVNNPLSIDTTNARLTDLGIVLCEKLEKYDFDNLIK